jgi:hypothetical protein
MSFISNSNIFAVNGPSSTSAITVDCIGNTTIEKLILKDEVTGIKWQLKISDGELKIEPLELIDKREVKIKKILDGNI